MRIAVVTRTLARIGGVEAYVETSVGGLRGLGHDVCVFPEDHARRTGLAVPAWTAGDGTTTALVAAVRAYAPDVVMCHGVSDPAMEEALAGMRPSAFVAHAYHGTCISGAKAHGFPGVRTCERTLGAGCLLRYYPRRCGGLNPVTMLRDFASQQRHLAAVRQHDRVFTLSAHVARDYVRHGVPQERVEVLPPPVPPVADVNDTTPDPFHVVYVGRLERLKGPAIAVAAVADAAIRLGRQLRLTLAGEGSALADVQRAIAAVPPGALQEIRLMGRLEPDACRRLLASAGLLVVPSVWPEPFGLVGFEAAACGVPAAAFRVGGIPEWLTDGVTGHLAVPGDDAVAALCEAIVLALADARHYAALREGAREAHAAAVVRDHIGALARSLGDLVRGEVCA